MAARGRQTPAPGFQGVRDEGREFRNIHEQLHILDNKHEVLDNMFVFGSKNVYSGAQPFHHR